MRSAQEVIKGLAIALAVLLICGIFSGIIGVGMMLSYVFRGSSTTTSSGEVVQVEDVAVVREVEIVTSVSQLTVKVGDKLEVRANEEIVELRQDGDKLIVQEKDLAFLEKWGERNSELVVVLPEGKLDRFTLEAGAGTVILDGVEADLVGLELGAGKTEIKNLKALKKAEIDGGVGVVIMQDVELASLDLDMGVGKMELSGKLTSDAKIDVGVGKLEMRLAGSEEDYRIQTKTGIGGVNVNGESMHDEQIWGKGNVGIEINGGLGAVEVEVR